MAVAVYLLWLLGWLRRRHFLLGLKLLPLLPALLLCMHGVNGMLLALFLYLPFVPLVAIWFWCGLGNQKNESA